MKAVTNKLSFKVADFALTAGVLLLAGAVARQTLFSLTGDEVLRVHRFEKNGQKGVVIAGDTAWINPKKPLRQPK